MCGQAVEMARVGEQLSIAQSEGIRRNEVIASLEGTIAALDAEIGQRDQKITQMAANLAEAEKVLDRRANELE